MMELQQGPHSLPPIPEPEAGMSAYSAHFLPTETSRALSILSLYEREASTAHEVPNAHMEPL